MLKHTLNIGLLDKDTLRQEIATDNAMSIIAGVIGNCTIIPTKGIYTTNDGI